MILLRLGDCFGRNGQVGHEFVEPMLAEDSAAKEVVDPVAGLAKVDAGAEGARRCETVGAAREPVLAQEQKQRFLRRLKRQWAQSSEV